MAWKYRLFRFDEVEKEEGDLFERRRKRKLEGLKVSGACTDTKSSLVGLALSGGGIRSAVSNLGLLQGLSKAGILQLIDILSVVSGGGYIGACLSSLLSPRPYAQKGKSCRDAKPLFSTVWENFPFRDDHLKPRHLDNDEKFESRDQIRHLRNWASYLVPRPVRFGTNEVRAAGSVSATVIIHLAWYISLMALLTILYMGLVSWSNPAYFADETLSVTANSQQTSACKETGGLKEAAKVIWAMAKRPFVDLPVLFISKTGHILFLTGLSFGLYLLMFGWFFYEKIPIKEFIIKIYDFFKIRYNVSDEESFEARWKLISISILTSSVLVGLLAYSGTLETGSKANILFPSIFCFGALAGSFMAFILAGFFDSSLFWSRNIRSRINLYSGLFFFFFLFTVILSLLPGCIKAGGAQWVVLIQAALALSLKHLLKKDKSRQGGKPSKMGAFMSKVKKYLVDSLVLLFIFFTVVGIGNFILAHTDVSKWNAQMDLSAKWSAIWNSFGVDAGISFVSLVLFSVMVNFNRLSPHYFYRDRLSDTFLRTFRQSGNDWGYIPARDDTDMPLRCVNACGSDKGISPFGPYLLINATLNLTAAKDLGGFNRRSSVFIFSRNFVGSERTGYARTETYPDEEMKLARAMTISGAAVTSVMGQMSSLAGAFACTIFGIRLGYWLQNPRHLCEAGYKRVWCWLPLLIKELFCRTDDNRKMIYLSDGGHSGDNLGITSLFKRKTKLIIVSDAECDHDFLFNSFNNSLRQAYVDNGIKVRISLDELMPDEYGFSTRYYEVGRVLYPQRPWQKSWIVLIKNTLTGKEIPPILNYKKKAAEFPHETTGDQFFSEEQFEAYKSLGRTKAGVIFSRLFPIIDHYEKYADGRYEKTDPWSKIDEMCCVLDPGQKDHVWDDILRALYDAEQPGYNSWKAFRKMIRSFVLMLFRDNKAALPPALMLRLDGITCLSDLESMDKFEQALKDLRKSAEPMAVDLLDIYEWLKAQGEQVDSGSLGPIPRSMIEFRAYGNTN